MIGRLPAATRNESAISVPRKKKEKKTNFTVDADGHTSFMHSLMGEDAREGNRQHIALDTSAVANPYGFPMNYYEVEANTSSHHPSNGQYNNDTQYNYAYANQEISDQNNMGIPPAGIAGDNNTGFQGNNNGYDYTKSFQMMPMQRFMGLDNYKYDSSAHQQLTDDTMRLQRPFKICRDSAPTDCTPLDSNLMSYYPQAFGGEPARNGEDVGDGDCGSDTHSAVGDGDHDPHKRKTRNQREQKR